MKILRVLVLALLVAVVSAPSVNAAKKPTGYVFTPPSGGGPYQHVYSTRNNLPIPNTNPDSQYNGQTEATYSFYTGWYYSGKDVLADPDTNAGYGDWQMYGAVPVYVKTVGSPSSSCIQRNPNNTSWCQTWDWHQTFKITDTIYGMFSCTVTVYFRAQNTGFTSVFYTGDTSTCP